MAQSGSPSRPGPARLLTQQDKLARAYQEEVYPLFGAKMADLLSAGLVLPTRPHVLQIGCGLGTTAAELLGAMDAEGRLIIIEASQPLIDRARANVEAEQLGKRAFLRVQELEGKLPFAENGVDLVLANVVVADVASPQAYLSELVRVTKPGGEVRLATLLAGTWREFLDVFSDVLIRLRKPDLADEIVAYRKTFPEPEALARQLEATGLGEVTVETTRWDLVFRSAREFFYAPVIEQGPLPRWKAIVGKGPEVQDAFLAIKEAIDTYFGGSVFTVGIYAGVFKGRKR